MKILNIKYIVPVSISIIIIIIAILYFTFIHIETQEEVPKRAILVLETELGGIVGG